MTNGGTRENIPYGRLVRICGLLAASAGVIALLRWGFGLRVLASSDACRCRRRLLSPRTRRGGVFDCLTKPFDFADLELSVKRAPERSRLVEENRALVHTLEERIQV